MQAEKAFYETALVQQATDAETPTPPSDDPGSGLRQRRPRNNLQLDDSMAQSLAPPVRVRALCGRDVTSSSGWTMRR